jgi:N utilization substance protein A
MELLEQIAQERDLPLEVLVETLEGALANAYKKHMNYPNNAHIRVKMDRSVPGGYRIFHQKEVVGFVNEPYIQIELEEAQKIGPEVEVGDMLEIELTHDTTGRIEAQTALQVLKQRIRELEREQAMKEIRAKTDDVVTGKVERIEGKTVVLSIGRIDGVLPAAQQAPHERYRFGDRLRVYILEIREREKDIRAIVSRIAPGLVQRLLELEVPEIQQGSVEIKAVAREPGVRSKIAVISKNPLIDAVGACIGHRGMRIQSITDELVGERVDVINWHRDPAAFITEAINPARVNRVVLDHDHKKALVVVPNNQLSLAIGRGGTNVKLASELTGWEIDVRSEAELASGKVSRAAAAEGA